ncbi:hypothetical protein AGLY_012667 [Aphis glycines]|uniref:Uncharacterized protein n=1 Tax=Aphis glycines TaxID=307491 RepID=A0A6G0T8A3_APHGL|nr:hypothetical protein AGLY_012667 [Aphis glycines]
MNHKKVSCGIIRNTLKRENSTNQLKLDNENQNPIPLLLYNTTNNYRILSLSTVVFENSERSEECIDFTMIITSRNNAPISNYGGGFRCKSEYPWCIIQFKFLRNLSKTRKFAILKIWYKVLLLIKLDTYLMTADVFFVRGNIDHATRAIAVRLLQKAGKILEVYIQYSNSVIQFPSVHDGGSEG